jgi:transcriptional regulator with XRE-family HTH domain
VRQKDKTDIRQRFGLAIRQRRQELGISQEELSFRAGLHRTYISDIERGSRNPSLENIEKLAKALEVSVSVLFASYGIEVERNS